MYLNKVFRYFFLLKDLTLISNIDFLENDEVV